MREDFNAWWRSPEQAELRKSCAAGWGYIIWQASRKSLVVELPPVCDCHSDDKDKGYDICHYAVQAKLKEQSLNFKVEGAERWSGITVKGEGG